jgi:hypothetical protein
MDNNFFKSTDRGMRVLLRTDLDFSNDPDPPHVPVVGE